MVPEGWRRVEIGEAGAVVTGSTPATNNPAFYEGGNVPFVSPADLGGGTDILDAGKVITEEGLAQVRGVPKGSTLFVCIGSTIGKIGFATRDLATNQQINSVVPFAENDPRFVFYAIALRARHIARLAGNQAVPIINKSQFSGEMIDLPPLAEQKRIAEVLGVWDRAIEVAGKQLDLARTQKRALMQTLLTPTRRFPGFEGQPWKDIPFNEVFDRIRRKNTVGNENVLTISGQDGLVSQSDYFNKRVAAKDLSGYTLLHGGDFAYNKSYSNGYPMGAIKVLSDGQSGVVSSLYLCFHIKDETQHSRDFFRHYFEAGRHEQEISLIAQEGARNHGLLNVGVSDFFETYLHVPDYPEQCRIAEVIGAAEASEQHAQTQITHLQAEKKALMQQLLTGKKRLAV